MKPHAPQNQLYVDNHILLRAGYPTPECHRHTALHFMIADPEYGVLRCEVEGAELQVQAVMIASDVEHTAMVDGMPIVMLFDVTSDLARSMEEQYLRSAPYHVPADDAVARLLEAYRKYVANQTVVGTDDVAAVTQNSAAVQKDALTIMADEALATLDAEILDILHLQQNPTCPMDPRIAAVIADLQEGDGLAQDSYARACEIACLSPGRFSHLFKEQAGISFRSYLVMTKLRTAYEGYLQGLNATEISMRAGFDSPSHFAGTIHRMFGLSFTDFAKAM